MRQIKLRTALTFVVLAALIPATVFSVVQSLAVLDYTRSLLGNNLAISALATAGQNRDQIVIAEQALSTLSRLPDVRSISSACDQDLQASLRTRTSVLNFARSDAQGRVRCSAIAFTPGLSFAKDEWWIDGVKKRNFSVSSPVMGTISGRRILVVMLPLYTADGRFDGAVTAALDSSWLKRSLAERKLADEAVVGISRSDGAVLMSDGPGQIPQFDPSKAVGVVKGVTGRDGISWIYSAAPLYGQDLFVIYAEPQQALMETAIQQVRVNLVLPIIALLLTLGGIYFAANRLVLKWLDALRGLAARFAAGNYESDPRQFGGAPEEIAALASSLHVMANAIEQRDLDLNAALTAKGNLTLEIHHRVKNNLQIVSSLLNLQARRISDPAAKLALDQTRSRIGALAQIHRLLYEDATEGEQGNVDIALLLNQVCSQLRLLHRGQTQAELICDVKPIPIAVDSAIPLSLFAVEAITNALRHGDGRTVTLTFSAEADEAVMRIIDDGVGYNDAIVSGSMGRQLMTAFAQQLGGTLEIHSELGRGTVVSLRYALDVPALAER